MLMNPLDSRRNSTKRTDLIATVIENDDTKHKDGKKRGRVRIRIPALHRNVPDDKLPWAMPAAGGSNFNAGSGAGSVNIPPIGAKVFVTYDEQDPHNPRYSSSPTTDDVFSENELLEEDYPNVYGGVDDAGNLTKVNKVKNTITNTHISGTTQHIDGSGNHSIFGKKNLDQVATENLVQSAGGKAALHAKGITSIKGSMVMINCSDAFMEGSAPGSRTKPVIKNPGGKDKA